MENPNLDVFTAGQAAKITGLSKPTITTMLKDGRLSGSRLQNGSYNITRWQLMRSFPDLQAEDFNRITSVKRGKYQRNQRVEGFSEGEEESKYSSKDVEILTLKHQLEMAQVLLKMEQARREELSREVLNFQMMIEHFQSKIEISKQEEEKPTKKKKWWW
jgi:hypothetical protein